MTLRQTAHAMIDTISNDNDIRLLIEIMGRFRIVENQSSPAVKKEALKAMERLRELYPMPTDIDYEKEREIAMGEKYGSLD